MRGRRLTIVAATTALVVLAAACDAVPGDFTGDRKADLVYFTVPSTAPSFQQVGSSAPLFTGQVGDVPAPGDYDGDLKWEPAVLRGTTWISSTLASPIEYDPAGMPSGTPGTPSSPYILGTPLTPPTLVPVPGDYDGTGKMVPAYYDEVDGSWWIMGHSGSVQFGVPPVGGGTYGFDVPVPADYDGDHKTDIATYRPSDGSFHYLSSKTGQEQTVSVGPPGSFPVPADYDKVGHAEPAVVAQVSTGPTSNYQWLVAGSSTPLATITSSGGIVPAPGDYDGDGHADAAQLDLGSGSWQLAGASPLATGLGGPVVPTELPIGTFQNVVRLAVYGQCLSYAAEFNLPNLC